MSRLLIDELVATKWMLGWLVCDVDVSLFTGQKVSSKFGTAKHIEHKRSCITYYTHQTPTFRPCTYVLWLGDLSHLQSVLEVSSVFIYAGSDSSNVRWSDCIIHSKLSSKPACLPESSLTMEILKRARHFRMRMAMFRDSSVFHHSPSSRRRSSLSRRCFGTNHGFFGSAVSMSFIQSITLNRSIKIDRKQA